MAGKIELKAPLDGVVTIEPEDTASNFTVTIPAVTSTLVNEDSDIEAQVKTATNATGDAPIYACRAWVNFDGRSGSLGIRESGNVSSVTRNAAGIYTINFATAMPDTSYSFAGGVRGFSGDGTLNFICGEVAGTYTASSFQARTWNATGSGTMTTRDFAMIFAQFFR